MTAPARIHLAVSLPLAAVIGAAYTLVFPPVAAAPLAWVALIPLLILLRLEDRVWAGALLGLGFGLAARSVELRWMYDVLAWELDLRRVVSAGFVAGVVALGSIGSAGFGAVAVALRRRLPFPVAAPLAWTAAEWAGAWLVDGMPWLLYGHSQYRSAWLIQLAELGGVPAISFLLVTVNALLAEAALPGRSGGARLRLLAGAAGVTALALGFGAWRLASFAEPPAGDPVPLGMVQTATPQRERWREETRRTHLDAQLALTRSARERSARLVVWSETALDFQPGEVPDPEVADLLASALGSSPGWALVGAVAEREPERRTNAAVLFDTAGRRLDAYEKIHLFPFLERGLPHWLAWIPGLPDALRKMTAERPYAAGRDPSPIEAAGLRMGLLICFEAIYPDRARAAVEAGATVLVNLSNDAFLPTAAVAEQHLAMSVFRAVETRRPLVRVANQGVGVVVDPLGRIRTRIERDVQAARVVEVAPREGWTVHTAGGHRLGHALAVLALLGCLPVRLSRGGRNGTVV